MASSTQSDKGSKAIHLYLVAYNFLQTIGWMRLLVQLILYYVNPQSKSLYDSVKYSLYIFQNAAVLEVIHAATGIVKSSAVMTAFQVASRVVVVCGVLLATESARVGLGLPLALLAWSITEIIRYSNYFFNLVYAVPFVLKYLRYTTFIVLYPIGVTGELLCIWAAQKEVGKNQLYSIDMPNRYNVIFNYQHVLWFLMVLYIPLFPQLYLYMFGQRKKALSKAKSK
ncbi:very-long-chain (3R)-3-hydroxyacyl-CoA dehydratase hpo-8 [Sitophilus oryzae]|uniref:Very-long-chain (3R)-3-hydroxyacyl-CoA dehydratase n=1 Tax=Sitophilus oryzae TaxID=7048 RepID=A0A6J2YPQ9_SITOR|nr:very-long-chain (3R)-3-hydroxyacyl-CoA dehydratase hpo-8 [Sitophilus oryzae]